VCAPDSFFQSAVWSAHTHADRDQVRPRIDRGLNRIGQVRGSSTVTDVEAENAHSISGNLIRAFVDAEQH